MSKKQYKIIFIGSIATLAFFFASYGIQKSVSVSKPSLEKSEIPTESIPVKNIISITIIAGDKTLQIASYTGTSLYDALVSAKDSGQIEFSGKNYSGLGFFMTSIGNLYRGNGENLFYYINNKEASVGVSSYLLQDGDIIEWKLK